MAISRLRILSFFLQHHPLTPHTYTSFQLLIHLTSSHSLDEYPLTTHHSTSPQQLHQPRCLAQSRPSRSRTQLSAPHQSLAPALSVTPKVSHPLTYSPPSALLTAKQDSVSNNTTIFRLLKVPKYAKRTLATMCERKSQELEEEVARLKRDWMEQESEIEWLRRELGRVQGELRAAKDGGYEGLILGRGQSTRLTEKEREKEELAVLWDC